MSTAAERDRLDVLLNESSPSTLEVTDDVLRELDLLVTASAPAARPARASRRWARPLAAGVVCLTLLGGAATAAAAATGILPPWFDNPDAVITYSLPSGAQCEHRVGNIQGPDPEAVRIAEQYFHATDLEGLIAADIDRVISDIRSKPNTLVHDDGTAEPRGYGTKYYNADDEYRQAAEGALSDGLVAKLEAAGIDGDTSSLQWEGQLTCSGADW